MVSASEGEDEVGAAGDDHDEYDHEGKEKSHQIGGEKQRSGSDMPKNISLHMSKEKQHKSGKRRWPRL